MNLTNYKRYELKAVLQHLKLKTSGTKTELVNRLSELTEEAVTKAMAAVITNDQEDDADSGNEWRDEVLQLRGIVEQLSNDIVSLRTSGSTVISDTEVVRATTTTSNTTTYSGASTHQAAVTFMQHNCQPPGMSGNYTQPSGVYTIPVSQNVFVPLPQMSIQSSTQRTPVMYRPITTTQLNNNQTVTQFDMPTACSPTATIQQMGQGQSIKEISSILPAFDPADESYTSIQFIERIERLKTVYGWNDTILIFAVLGKLKGVAKQWADAQPVFETWVNFVAQFLCDFPYVRSKASAHIKLMSSKMSRNEKFLEYYYRMLALGRREDVDDASIIQYIINGIFDENVKRTLSAMCFNNCSDLLKSMMSVNNMNFDRQVWQKRSFEVSKNYYNNNDQKYNISSKGQNEVPKTNGSGPICFNCRQRGHISRNCPKPQRKYQNDHVNNLLHGDLNDDDVVEAEINTVHTKKINELTKDVFICADDMIKCCALIDSGSGKSLIKRSVSTNSKCVVVPCREKLMGFAGGKIVCYEKMLADVKIDDIVRTVELIIIEDDVMSYDMIIGLDVLSKGTVIIENSICKIMPIKNSPVEIVSPMVSGHEENKFTNLIMTYGDCFGKKLNELGRSRRFKMDIVLNSVKPIYKRPYNIPFTKREVVERIVNELLDLRIVRPSSSLYASPIVMVAKQNGEGRLCVDYRELNSVTERIQSEQKKQIETLYALRNNRLFQKGADSSLTLVIPKGMRWRILKLYHDDIGHPAVDKVIERVKQHFWFPRMRNFVKSYIKSCIECAYHKEPGRKACQLYGMQIPSLPFVVLHLDHLGPFIKGRRGYEYVLVCVDALTRYVVIHPTKTTHTKHVIGALEQLTLYFGLPKTIVTDRGTAFTSAAFEEYCYNNSIQHVKVAVRTPRANGLAERVNQSIITYLKTTTVDPKDWDSNLREMQWTLNTKINSTTKFAPLDLIFDFPLRDISGNKLLAALHDDINLQMNNRRKEAMNSIEKAREKWKARFDAKHTIPIQYSEGDLVLIESPIPSTGESRKLQPKYKGPYVVTKVLRYDRYVVENLEGMSRTKRRYSSVSASDKMKPFCALFPEVDDNDENDIAADDDEIN